MFKILARSNIIRRFTHTRCKSNICQNNICQNNKILEQLVQQNKFLKEIDSSLTLITFNTGLLTGVTIVLMLFK